MGIVLLGYRGSGKSTVGRLLAERLRLPFVDSDEEIVKRAGKTIREIFESQGEATFRDLETISVAAACEHDVVASIGGGAVLRPQNREVLRQSAHQRIYLRCDARILHDRIHADPMTAAARPSLTHLGGSLAEIQTLLGQRDPIYRQVMTHLLDVDHLLPEAVADRIVEIRQKAEGRTQKAD